MAAVHEYLIITSTGHDYRAEGINHRDALRNFVDTPAIITGFHGGDYRVSEGEQFNVIGPGEDGPMTFLKLQAVQRESFIFKTPDQVRNEEHVADSVRTKIGVLIASDRVELKVTENLRTPPYDLTTAGDAIEAREHGVRLNNITVPWGYVEDLIKLPS